MRNNEKVIAILAGERKFEYKFMEKEINQNPKYFYDILFDEHGKYVDKYKFKPWVIDELISSIARNTKGNYSYHNKGQLEQYESDVYNKSISDLITEKLQNTKLNKKIIELFNSTYSRLRDYYDLNNLPILQILKKGYQLDHYILSAYFDSSGIVNTDVIYLMFQSSSFPSEVFKEYIVALDNNQILELIGLGFEICTSVINWYIETIDSEKRAEFNFERLDFLIENSIVDNKTAIYENLFLKLIQIQNYDLLVKFDFTKIDLYDIIEKSQYKIYSASIDDYIIKNTDEDIFELLVSKGYKLSYGFLSSYINENTERYHNNEKVNTPKRVMIYYQYIKNMDLKNGRKSEYLKKMIKVSSTFGYKTTLYDLLNEINDVELLEYGLELLFNQNNVIFFIYKLDSGYVPSKKFVKKIIRAIFTHIRSKFCESIKIENKFEKELFYMKTLPKRKNCMRVFVGRLFKKLLPSKRLNTSWDITFNKYQKCKNFYKNSKKIPKKNINLNLNYIYFPLHLQPELTTSAIGNKYADQILALEQLTSFLPNDYFIYVKENPKQTYKERNSTFYKRLSLLDNVILVSPVLNTYDLIKNSKFVATITGTVGYEALSGGKAVLAFGSPWYKNLHGVFVFNDNLNFQKIINFKISHELLQLSFDKLMLKSREGLIDIAYKQIIPNFDNNQNMTYLRNFIYEEIEQIKAYNA